MAKKLYVGNLSWNTTENQLQELFSQVGTVDSVTIITEKESGRSKGFAFIEMSSEEEAQEAISKLNGQTVDERSIVVNEARPQTPR